MFICEKVMKCIEKVCPTKEDKYVEKNQSKISKSIDKKSKVKEQHNNTISAEQFINNSAMYKDGSPMKQILQDSIIYDQSIENDKSKNTSVRYNKTIVNERLNAETTQEDVVKIPDLFYQNESTIMGGINNVSKLSKMNDQTLNDIKDVVNGLLPASVSRAIYLSKYDNILSSECHLDGIFIVNDNQMVRVNDLKVMWPELYEYLDVSVNFNTQEIGYINNEFCNSTLNVNEDKIYELNNMINNKISTDGIFVDMLFFDKCKTKEVMDGAFTDNTRFHMLILVGNLVYYTNNVALSFVNILLFIDRHFIASKVNNYIQASIQCEHDSVNRFRYFDIENANRVAYVVWIAQNSRKNLARPAGLVMNDVGAKFSEITEFFVIYHFNKYIKNICAFRCDDWQNSILDGFLVNNEYKIIYIQIKGTLFIIIIKKIEETGEDNKKILSEDYFYSDSEFTNVEFFDKYLLPVEFESLCKRRFEQFEGKIKERGIKLIHNKRSSHVLFVSVPIIDQRYKESEHGDYYMIIDFRHNN